MQNWGLKLFHTICLLTTIAFVAWCISEYTLDNDYTQTKFATFHRTVEDIYPSVTICVQDPYVRDKYDSYLRSLPILGKAVDGSYQSKILNSYKLFISGDKGSSLETKDWLRNLNTTYAQWIHGLQQIDYDDITSNLDDLLTKFYIQIPIRFDHLDTLSYNASNGSLVADEITIKRFEQSTIPNQDEVFGGCESTGGLEACHGKYQFKFYMARLKSEPQVA